MKKKCTIVKHQEEHQEHHYLLRFHHHHELSGDHKTAAATALNARMPPKGSIVALVGEERQRFAVPITRLGHWRFAELLADAEREYGFEQEGAIAIPCSIGRFKHVLAMIEGDYGRSCHHSNRHHLHLPHFGGCFRA